MTAHFLSDFLPVRNLFEIRSCGIEVAERSIRYLELISRGTRYKILAYGTVELPPGAIVDTVIRDAPAVVKALAEVRSRVRCRRVHASLPDAKAHLFDLVISHGGAPMLKDDIAIPLSEHSTLSPAEIVFGYEKHALEASDFHAYVITIFPKKIARSYLETFAAADLAALSFELSSQAATRALTMQGTSSMHEARLLICFGFSETTFSIVHNGMVRFTATAQNGPESSATFDASAAALAMEVKRILVHWHSHVDCIECGEKITSIILYGENADLRELAGRLTREFGIPAELADFRAALGGRVVPSMHKDESLKYVTVLGLALRAGKNTPVNLLTEALRKGE